MVGPGGAAPAGGVGASSDGALRLGLDLTKVDLDGLLACLSHGEGHAARPRPRAARSQQPAAGALAAQRQAPAPGAQRPSGGHSRLHGPALAGGRCGERLRFTVTVCDDNAEVCRNSNATVTALVEGLSLMSKTHPEPRPRVESNDDGTYSVQFVCATPGSYNVTVSVDGVAMPMCPLQIDVGPGPASAHKSEVQGKDSQVVDLGGMGKFTVVTHDEFGNLCHEGGSRLGVRALGHVKLLEVTDNEDGTYQVVYSVPEWAQGPVKIEVLLDGVRLKDSPVSPQVRRQPQRDTSRQQAAPGTRSGERSLQDQFENLRWLRENPPAEVPVLPPVTLLEGAAAGIPQALGGAASGAAGGPAAAAAWRVADEWRQLSEARAEIANAREELRRHQEVLLSVGNAVHGEYIKIQDRDRDVSAKMRQLEQAEDQLQNMRAELGRQYIQQQATASSPTGYASLETVLTTRATTARELAHEKLGIRAHGREQPPRPGAGAGRSAADPRGWSALDAVGGEDSLVSDEMSQLLALREGLEGKRRYLQQLEEDDRRQSGPRGPSLRGGQLAGELPEAPASLPGPPRVAALPPPELEDWAGSPSGTTNSLGTGAQRSPGGLLSSPPSSPAPPPEWPGSPASAGDADIGRVMKHIFRSYASKSGGSAALPPRGARSGRVALCKQDLVRLAQAAQLRIPRSELEDAFDGTARRFGALSLGQPESAEPALPFELFVELVTETARRQYSDLPEGEATRLLFEKHFVPLSRRLTQLEG